MSNDVFKAPTHGARFDNFTREASHPHGGSYYDEGFNEQEHQDPHDPQFDGGFRGNTGAGADPLMAKIQALPKNVRNLSAGCPACGYRHTLADALRAVRPAGKSARDTVDVHKMVRETDEPFLRSGVGEPDALHEALVANIKKTYGDVQPTTVAKGTKGARRPPGSFDQAIEILRRMPRLKT